MKKVVILVDQLYRHGGIEKLVVLKANYWVSKFNYNVSIVCTENLGNKPVYQLNAKVRLVDLKINYQRSKSYFSRINLFKLFLNTLKIQKLLLVEKPDVVIVASHIPLTYILPLLKKNKTKLIKEFHFTRYFNQSLNSLKDKFFQYIESKYNAIVVLSEEEKSMYTSKNIMVIPNFIHEAKTPITPINQRPNIACAVMRFAPVKRLELMVQLWSQFSKKNQDWVLKIYGDYNNPYGKTILKLIHDLKLTQQIVLEGEINNVSKELSNSKLLLITSQQECFPMVILESMAVGVPTMAFNCPTGPRNIIANEKNGILIPNDAVNMFAHKLYEYSVDVDRQNYLSKNALTESDSYKIDRIMQQWNNKILN